MSKEITIAYMTLAEYIGRVYSDTQFTLIAVNQTTQIFESSTLYNWLYNCIPSAKSLEIIYTTTHSLPKRKWKVK